jgi:alpha-L-rhamnosidase
MTTAIDLRCEYLAHPLGVDVPGPRLSWTLWSDERGQRQTAYRILVASTPELLAQHRANLWDTGKVDSDRTCHVAYAGKPLRSLQRCYWKVQVWDRYGQPSDWSEVTWWEMGILSPDAWQAKWIRAPIAEPAPLFRKEFAVWSGLQRARALICGLGYYELYLNGKRIGEQVLDPAQTDYERRAFYVVHDVTDALREGINCVGVMLGNGWFHQAIVWGGMSYGEPVLLLQLILEYEDGRVETVCTDESWKTTPGPVLKNNVYGRRGVRRTARDTRLERAGAGRFAVAIGTRGACSHAEPAKPADAPYQAHKGVPADFSRQPPAGRLDL